MRKHKWKAEIKVPVRVRELHFLAEGNDRESKCFNDVVYRANVDIYHCFIGDEWKFALVFVIYEDERKGLEMFYCNAMIVE